MRAILSITLFVFIASVSLSEEGRGVSNQSFYIKDVVTGRLFGPFESKARPPHGEYVLLYTPETRSSIRLHGDDGVGDKVNYFISIKKNGSTLEYVTAQELHVNGLLAEKKISQISLRQADINKVVNVVQTYLQHEDDQHVVRIVVKDSGSGWANVPPISFSMTNASVIDVLEYVRQVYGVSFRIDGYRIQISPPDKG